MTRWNLLSDVLMSHSEHRGAIGSAWPLFFYLIFNMKKDNKLITTYAELKEKLNESPNTIRAWRDHLVEHKVVQVFKGSISMSFVFISPYDSLVTCEQDDIAQVKMTGDPRAKRLLDKISAYENMPLLPLIMELNDKISNLEKKLV
jgi:hypothetical protein